MATHQNKSGPKHGPNGIPPYAVPLPYYPATVTPFFHTMVPIPPTSAPGYAYQFPPRPFPRADAQLVKSGNDRAQAFVPPVNGSFQPSARSDSSAHTGSVGRRRSTNDQYGQMNPSWNNQRPVASNNFHLQQTVGPRPFIRPPFFGPIGFVDGPNYPGICATL